MTGTEMAVSAKESESVLTTDESGFSNSSQNPPSSSATGPLAAIVYGMFKPKQDIIPRMLAPKHSLLNMCLRRGKYSQAEQVVKVIIFFCGVGREHFVSVLLNIFLFHKSVTNIKAKSNLTVPHYFNVCLYI